MQVALSIAVLFVFNKLQASVYGSLADETQLMIRLFIGKVLQSLVLVVYTSPLVDTNEIEILINYLEN